MANININIENDTLKVYKGIDFDFTFSIDTPVVTENDKVSKAYIFNYKQDIEDKIEYSTLFSKNDWIEVRSFEYEITNTSENILVTGIPRLKYRYKVDLLDSGGTVVQLIKDYSDKWLTTKMSDTVTIPINLIATSINPYYIRVMVILENNQEFTVKRDVELYNESPTIAANVKNNNLYLQIDDEENDLIKYSVKLNGVRIFPEDTEFTALGPPVNEIIKLKSENIRVNEKNKITIHTEDNWGKSSFFSYDFIGEFVGLLFLDDEKNYYSNDIGDIIKRLDFNTVVAGNMSDLKKVIILNNTGMDIKDLKFTITPEKLPNKLSVLYGFDESSLIENTQELIFSDIIKNKEEISLYLKIYPDIEFEQRYGTFEIKAHALPVI